MSTIPSEGEWRRIPGLPRYLASANGTVWDTVLGRPLAASLDTKGYPKVRVHFEDGGYRTRTVHRLVATAFLENPQVKPTVNHKDGDRTNNFVSNLEWATHGENLSHAYATGLKDPYRPSGEKHHMVRLSESDIRAIRSQADAGRPRLLIADDFGISKNYVSAIKNRRAWAHLV